VTASPAQRGAIGSRPDPAAVPSSEASLLNLANALTGIRLVLVPVFLLLLFAENGESTGWRIAAWVAFALAMFTDQVDGQVARAWGQVTEFGKLADPIADKALTGSALVALVLLDELAWWVAALVLARELGVTLLRFWVLRHGVMPASRGGKLKTFLLSVAIGMYVLPLHGVLHDIAELLMAAAVVVALVTGLDYVQRALRLRKPLKQQTQANAG
jgi:CDP-diacylglycerol--glycerol-3-phosphate 3-phosphatidyltransferase